MDRRSFLKGIAAAPVVAALPFSLPNDAVKIKNASVAGALDTRTQSISDAILHTVRKTVHDSYSKAGFISHQTLVDINTNKHYIRQTMAGGQWSDWKEMSSNV